MNGFLTCALFVATSLHTPLLGQLIHVPERVEFGPTRVGSTAGDTLRFINNSAHSHLIDRVDLPEPAFSATPVGVTTASIQLETGDTLRLAIIFAPTAVVSYANVLHLDGTDGSRVTVPLLGEGVASVLVIDEVLADPPTGLEGDSNGDGVRHSSEDEFVEILNISTRPADLTELVLTDLGTESGAFRFPDGTVLPPGERAVLFGGGQPMGLPGTVFVDDGKIGKGLTNSGDGVVLLHGVGGDTLDAMTYGSEGGRDQSLVREPQGTGAWVKHSDPPGQGRFSPGTARPSMIGAHFSQDNITIAPGESSVLDPVGFFADGGVVNLAGLVSYVSSPTGIVEMHGDTAVAIAAGHADLTGSLAGFEWRAIVNVTSGPIDGLRLLPADTLVVLGQSVRYTALGVVEDDLTPIGGVLLSADPDSVAVVVGDSVRMIGAGSGTVVAQWEDFVTEATIRSASAGDLDGDGRFTLTDIVRIIDLILTIGQSPTPFESASADLTHDGSIDLLDLTAVVVKMLGGPVRSTKPGLPQWRAVRKGRTLEIAEELSGLIVASRDLSSFTANWGGTISRRTAADGRTIVVLIAQQKIDGVKIEVGYGTIDRAIGFDRQGQPRRIQIGENRNRLVCYPNPFKSSTVLEFRLGMRGYVDVSVFSAIGQRVAHLRSAVFDEGRHRLVWEGLDRSGRRLASGVYVITLTAAERRDVAKMVLLQ